MGFCVLPLSNRTPTVVGGSWCGMVSFPPGRYGKLRYGVGNRNPVGLWLLPCGSWAYTPWDVYNTIPSWKAHCLWCGKSFDVPIKDSIRTVCSLTCDDMLSCYGQLCPPKGVYC